MKKKAMESFSYLIGIIVSLFILLLCYFLFQTYFEDSNYEKSIIECSSLISGIEGKQAFFGEELNMPNNFLLETLGKICSGKSVMISKNNVKPATELVKDCWIKSAKGKDFLASNVKDKGVCIYCGSINAKEDIENFGDLFNEEISKKDYEQIFKETSEIVNMNKQFLKNKKIVSEINEKEKSLSVFYLIYKPEYPQEIDPLIYLRDTVGTQISEYFGSQSNFFSDINYILSSSVSKSIGGIIITSNIKINEEDSTYSDSINSFADICSFVIPEKIYD